MDWQNTHSVGVPALDDQHRQLFDLFDKAHDACLNIMQPDSYGNIVKELTEYVLCHFTAEEMFMEENNYPDLAAHRYEHTQLARKIGDFSELMCSGYGVGTIEMIELTEFLNSWLRHHILEVDMGYSNLSPGN